MNEEEYDELCAEIESQIMDIDTKGLVKELSITWKKYEELSEDKT